VIGANFHNTFEDNGMIDFTVTKNIHSLVNLIIEDNQVKADRYAASSCFAVGNPKLLRPTHEEIVDALIFSEGYVSNADVQRILNKLPLNSLLKYVCAHGDSEYDGGEILIASIKINSVKFKINVCHVMPYSISYRAWRDLANITREYSARDVEIAILQMAGIYSCDMMNNHEEDYSSITAIYPVDLTWHITIPRRKG